MHRDEGRQGLPHGRFVSIGLFVAALLSTGAASSFPEDTVVRWYDVRSLHAVGVVDPGGVDLRLPLRSSFLHDLEPDDYGVHLEEHDEPGPDGWLEGVLYDLDDRWPGSEFDAESRAGFLRVEASPLAHEEFAAVLGDLRRHVSRSVEVEVFVLPASVLSGDTRSVLGAEQATALLAGVEPLDYSRKSARLGQRVLLGGEGLAATLIDYDVEVAKKSRVPDPQVTVLYEGIHLGVIVRESLGGGYRVRTWGRRAVPEDPPRQIVLDHFGGAPLELPATSSALGVGSATIPNGGCLVLGQDWSPDGVWLIRVSETDAGRSLQVGGSRFVPLGDLTSVPLLVGSPRLPHTQPSGGLFVPEESIRQQLGETATERLFSPDDLRDRVRERAADLELEGRIALVGHSLYLRGTPAFLDWASGEIGELHRGLVSETVELDVRFSTLKRGAALQLVSANDLARLVERLDQRLLGACRLGDSLLLLGGTERFYLKDHDVEIAESAAIPDPIIDELFEGVSFWCRPSRVGGGTLSAWVDLQVHEAARDPRRLPISVWEPREVEQRDDDPAPTGTYTLNAQVELPATARAELTSNVLMKDGEWTLLCCTGLAGSDRSLVAVARARVLSR